MSTCPSDTAYFSVVFFFPWVEILLRGNTFGLHSRNQHSSSNCQAARLQPEQQTQGRLVFLWPVTHPVTDHSPTAQERVGPLPGPPGENDSVSETQEGHVFLFSFLFPLLKKFLCTANPGKAARSCRKVVIDNIHQVLLGRRD